MPSIYERKAEYWTRDLADRSLEQAVRAGLDALGWEYQDNTAAFDRPDFYIFRSVRGQRVRVALEVKEKRQPYRGRWAQVAGVPATELLILDEVAARKLLAWAPRAALLFWDETQSAQPYVLLTIVDLLCVPKVRVLRPIVRNSQQLKAKWLLDRRHGRLFADLNGALGALASYVDREMYDDLRRVDLHGSFVGERIETL